MRSFAFALAAIASLVSAETFTVKVGRTDSGEAGLVYSPNQVTAKTGDRVQFQFYAKNHTVTQSSFAEPCTQQLNTVTNAPGIDSGFLAVAPDATEIPVWEIEVVQDTAPQWFFCNQGNHCNSGMVFAINAPAEGERTIATFIEKAKTATHPDPALGVTAPFTPPGAASSGAEVSAGPVSTGSPSSARPSSTGSPNQTGSALKLSSAQGAGIVSVVAVIAGLLL